MLVTALLWTTLGLVLGGGMVFAFAGNSFIRDSLLRQVLRSNKTGWLLTQRGTRYTLDPVTRDEDAGVYRVGSEDDAEYAEDSAGLMHTLEGVPLGLRLERQRSIVDVDMAESAHAAAEKRADGGLLAADDPKEKTLAEVEDDLIVGKVRGDQRDQLYINPFAARDMIPDVLDLRNAAKLMRHDSDPNTPRKTAKNATEAERAFESWGDLKEMGKVAMGFVLGMVATYAGTTAGGGGGGGNPADAVNIGLSIVPVGLLPDLMVVV